MVTVERLKEVLSYNPETGEFRWSPVPRKGVRSGQPAGNITTDGNGLRIRIDRIAYKAHRLAWLYVHGRWPSIQIDHINGNPYDNRLVNLREATPSQNQGNQRKRVDSTSGRKGVARSSAKQERWRAHFRGRYLGSFETKEDAHAAYQRAAAEHFGEFARYE